MNVEFPATERARASLELLYIISRELASKLDLRELLQRILLLTLDNVGAASGSIIVLDDKGHVIEGAMVYNGKVHDHTAERLAETFERGLAGWVVDHRQPTLVGNTLDDPRWLRRPGGEAKHEPRSAICAPLLAGERITGVLTLSHPKPNHFSEDNLNLLQAIADQAGIAVENARLFKAEQERHRFASTLQEITRIINSALDPALVFPQVLEQLERVIEYDSASIYVLDQSTLRLAAARGFEDGETIVGQTLPLDQETLASQVLAAGQPIVVADVQEDPRWIRSEKLPGSSRTRAWIGAPLMLRDRAVGLLNLDSHQPGAYGPAHVEVVSTFADHAATSVANAQLYADSQIQLRATRTLAETSRVISASLQLDDVLQGILTQTMGTLEVDAASLALVDPETDELEFKVASGVGATEIIGMRLKPGEGIAGWVAERGEPAIVPDVTNDPRFYPGVDEKLEFTTRAIVAAPIRVQQDTIGVLEAINPRRGEFTPDQVELLMGIAGMAGTAISHAQLFSESQAARTRYTGLFEDSIDPILITDTIGFITEANHSAKAFLGHATGELLGKSITSIHKPDPERLPADLRELKPGETISYESEATHKEGHSLPIEIHVKRIDLDRQTFLQWIFHDISERLALDELRADLTSMIFHDLRSPLGNVLSSLEVLRTSLPEEDEALQSVLAISLRSGRRLSRLIESLLDLGQLEAGQAVLHKSEGSLNALIAEAVEEVYPIAEAKDHRLDFDLTTSTLPSVEMDVDMIRRVVINLLENAIKYTRQGGQVTISARKEDHEVIVEVSDNGPGISPRDQQHIFEKFARVQYEGRPKGLGLGLAFCRLAVEAHGGRIWVESESGKGTIFSFALPV